MLTIPVPIFNEQDLAQPIPNLDPGRLNNSTTLLTLNFSMLTGDFFILSLNSSVLGGTYNQSFNVAQDTASLTIQIPTSFVLTSVNTVVQLIARIQRAGITSFAPSTSVRIGSLPIVVPTPGIVWDFNDNTFRGWVPQGSYIGGLLRVINQRVVVDVLNSQPGRSHIITRSIQVTAGRTYDFAFDVTANSPVDGSTVYMTLNGNRIGSNVANITPTQQTGTGTYTATTTGNVTLGVFNDTVPLGRHSLFLDNIRMTQRP